MLLSDVIVQSRVADMLRNLSAACTLKGGILPVEWLGEKTLNEALTMCVKNGIRVSFWPLENLEVCDDS